MSIDLSQFVGEFLEESKEGLDLMETNLLNFSDESEIVDSIFRAAHSIKGGAGTFGFSEIAKFTHGIETILDEMREDCQFASTDVINLLLESVDMIRLMLAATQENAIVDQLVVGQLSARIADVIDNNAISMTGLYEDATDKIEGIPGCLTNSHDEEYWLITFKPSVDMLKSGNEPVHLFQALTDIGQLSVEPFVDNLPALEEFDGECIYIYWCLKLWVKSSDREKISQDIQEVFEWVEDLCELTITPAKITEELISSPTEDIASESSIQQGELEKDHSLVLNDYQVDQKKIIKNNQTQTTDISSVRVDTEKLDELMNRVGELVVTHSMLAQVLDGLVQEGHQDQRLEQGILQLESNTRDLQEGVMRMRMLPISFVFNRFPRLVHDICSNLGKKAQLAITGAQTEIDKTVMEKIGDPLTHLIRNALDHGLESPQERIKCGKSEIGTIALNAYHQNGFVVIDIIDDGRGLNLKKIQQKAISNGLINQDQMLNDEETKALIFKAGFSTVDEVSELSGRGVGMDVVLRNVESLGGQVSVHSVEGEGASFRVKVPLTLAIIEGQMIYVGSDIYVLPLISITETVFIKATEIKSLGNYSHFMKYREEYIHLLDLKELCKSSTEYAKTTQKKNLLADNTTSLLVIVAESGGKKVGLVIDHLAGQQQFVVKPLETNFRKVQGLVGGTILGDGNVALILDVAGLIAKDEYRNSDLPNNSDIALLN
ncbi:MAG: chemotaxis protein CheA [Oceanospirillaceae bacterium]|nr:chemotaxis protein CheA [Oceanospirillaceae bacterium]